MLGLQEIASKIIKEWHQHHDFIKNRSNARLEQVSPFGGLVWELRRKACMRTARNLLRVLADEDMEECLERTDEMMFDLKREWRDDGRLSQHEIVGRGWAWVSGGEY